MSRLHKASPVHLACHPGTASCITTTLPKIFEKKVGQMLKGKSAEEREGGRGKGTGRERRTRGVVVVVAELLFLSRNDRQPVVCSKEVVHRVDSTTYLLRKWYNKQALWYFFLLHKRVKAGSKKGRVLFVGSLPIGPGGQGVVDAKCDVGYHLKDRPEHRGRTRCMLFPRRQGYYEDSQEDGDQYCLRKDGATPIASRKLWGNALIEKVIIIFDLAICQLWITCWRYLTAPSNPTVRPALIIVHRTADPEVLDSSMKSTTANFFQKAVN